MQEELSVVRQAVAKGDRLAAVLSAHQSLEDELSSAAALVALIIKEDEMRKKTSQAAPPSSSTTFDAWAALQAHVEKIEASANVCLRLFNPARVMESTKGLDTIAALYSNNSSSKNGRTSAPTCNNVGDRVKQFLQVIEAKIQALSPSLVLSGARAMQQHASPQGAADMVHDFVVQSSATHSSQEGGEQQEEAEATATLGKLQRFIHGHDSHALERALPTLLALQIDCAARAGDEKHSIAAQEHMLSGVVSAETMDKLLALEVRCRKEYPLRQARLEERRLKNERAVALADLQQKSAGTANSNNNNTSSTLDDTKAAATAERTWGEFALNPLRLQAGWKLHASRAATVLLTTLLFAVLFRRALRVLYRAVSAAHAPPARRALTL